VVMPITKAKSNPSQAATFAENPTRKITVPATASAARR